MQRLVVLAVAAALLATACSSPRPASPLTPSRSSVPAGPQTFTVSVDGKSPSYNLAADAYFPSALKVHPGDTIQFREVWSGEPHTVTFGTLVDRYEEPVRRVARAVLHDVHDADGPNDPPAETQQQILRFARVPRARSG